MSEDIEDDDEFYDVDFDSEDDETFTECLSCDGRGTDFLSGATCPHCGGSGWF